ncbi:hypothetical protein CLOM_g16982 [Closterium sp. NIES-68]|nr:hypothetical protein CLOM_g16982 [Closterium sp. NIES-68]GJP62766.1 hypothetical protein CLOP_g19793 [Closterium sp. NIES-67]
MTSRSRSSFSILSISSVVPLLSNNNSSISNHSQYSNSNNSGNNNNSNSNSNNSNSPAFICNINTTNDTQFCPSKQLIKADSHYFKLCH